MDKYRLLIIRNILGKTEFRKYLQVRAYANRDTDEWARYLLTEAIKIKIPRLGLAWVYYTHVESPILQLQNGYFIHSPYSPSVRSGPQLLDELFLKVLTNGESINTWIRSSLDRCILIS